MKLETYLSDTDTKAVAFALRVGCSHATIYRILNGKRRPSWSLAKQIERATGGAVTPEDLLGDGRSEAA